MMRDLRRLPVSSNCRCTSVGAAHLGVTTCRIAGSALGCTSQVLREGNDDDVRWFVRVDEVIDLWDELVLPCHVRQAWAKW